MSMSVSNAFQMRGEVKKAEIIRTIDEVYTFLVFHFIVLSNNYIKQSFVSVV